MKTKRAAMILMVLICLFGSVQAVFCQDKASQTWSAKSQSSEYRISAGDVLEIATWKEPELTRKEVLVRVDGKISFPLLGDVQATGVTPVELTETLQKGLKNYVTAPVVTVYVAPHNAMAGSAGALITVAAHASAMAPETIIGASSPIDSSGQDLNSDARAKATNASKAAYGILCRRAGLKRSPWPRP